MTDTLETEAIVQALEIIDRGLGVLHQRELVSTVEVSDLLLDVRSALVAPGMAALEADMAVSSAN